MYVLTGLVRQMPCRIDRESELRIVGARYFTQYGSFQSQVHEIH